MAVERTRTSPAGNRGFGLLEVLAALVILGLALTAVIPLVNQQREVQTRVRLRDQALREARNIMAYWLNQPHPRLGTYRGRTASGMDWEVRLSDLSLADRRRRHEILPKTTSPYARKSLTAVPDRVRVRVCCRYRWLGRQR